LKYTVGSVPYANAIPLVAIFEEREIEPSVRVVYDVPSRLPALLERGEADAILVSSVDALLVPGRRMADGVCIGSHGPVKSVRLFSKVPPTEIQSLALDQSSMTSNRLAQIILKERYDCAPTTSQKPPVQHEMLLEHDACVLIGDVGMTAPSEGLHVLDLGEEWHLLTGRPFVWAAWIGNEGLTRELAFRLAVAPQYYGVGLPQGEHPRRPPLRAVKPPDEKTSAAFWESRRDELIPIAQARSGWSESVLRDYYFEVMVYEMNEFVLSGLREYQRLLLKHGFDDCVHFPELVPAVEP
jgi:chorismate dehydratase